MRKSAYLAVALSFGLVGMAAAQAPAQPAPPPQPPQFPNMTFFITGAPGPDGANFGGLEGADAICQRLATSAGAGAKTWRAYLSQQATGGKTAVNARDRIGKGPWVNARGVEIAANIDDLHNPEKNKINVETGLTETGRMVMSRLFVVNYHDILTGTNTDGTAFPADKDMTCNNWTSGGAGSAMVGHHDRMGLNDQPPAKSWNASHPSRGCDNPSLRATGGNGLFYCFAAN
ncbi:MAG: lectin [Rhizobiales bacterium]|nr:lectin [Hyphomicrobiales bacterium]